MIEAQDCTIIHSFCIEFLIITVVYTEYIKGYSEAYNIISNPHIHSILLYSVIQYTGLTAFRTNYSMGSVLLHLLFTNQVRQKCTPTVTQPEMEPISIWTPYSLSHACFQYFVARLCPSVPL